MRLITLLIVLTWISALTANRADAESILLKREGGVLVLPVQVNERITLDFTIDSGAADVVIPRRAGIRVPKIRNRDPRVGHRGDMRLTYM